MSEHRLSLLFILLLFALLPLGCDGCRDNAEISQCATNADCPIDSVCLWGQCRPFSQEPDTDGLDADVGNHDVETGVIRDVDAEDVDAEDADVEEIDEDVPDVREDLPDEATDLCTGSSHACALLSDSTVACWGYNYWGQLGTGSRGNGSGQPFATRVTDLDSVHQIACGNISTCALLNSGRIQCWGANRHGQLGDGTTSPSATPVDVIGVDDAIQIAAGYGHACALLTDKTMVCWGFNMAGQLGNGEGGSVKDHEPTPTSVDGLAPLRSIAAGDDQTCAITEAGALKCWGDNFWGALGRDWDQTREDFVLRPIDVPDVDLVEHISIGGNFICATDQRGAAACWGHNRWGQLGNGQTAEVVPEPVSVLNANAVTDLGAGHNFGCAIDDVGLLDCWGTNHLGQLGAESDQTHHASPVLPDELRAVDVEAGDNFACTIADDASVWCWGAGRQGELGQEAEETHNLPMRVDL